VESGSLPQSPVVLPLRGESWSADPGRIVVVESGSPNESFISIGRSSSGQTAGSGRIKSELNISKPFISLAIAAPEAELVVYNAVSSNADGLNDYLRIENIENYPGNKLSVYSRWGDKVFEIEDYDNDKNVFTGHSNVNGQSELVSGSYFYVLELPGRESLRGFIAVKN
jgi:gliding motility-associated-like protein